MRPAYLVQCSPYDPDTAAVSPQYLSIGSLAPVYDGKLWRGRLQQEPSFSVEAFSDPVIGGRSSASIGVLVVRHGDDGINLRNLNWHGRGVEVKRGDRDAAFGSFSTVVRGRVRSIEWDRNGFMIGLSDLASELEVPLQDALYAGTGGDEGGDDVKGRPKPRCLGKPRNVTPVLIDRANLIYQFSDRAAKAVDAVYDQGIPLTSEGDVATLSLADIRDWPACGGRYVTDLSRGLIRLGAAPAGTPTVDAQGDMDSGTLIQTAGDLVRHVAGQVLTDPDDLDTASFSGVNTANAAPCSLYVSDGRPTIREVAEQLMSSIGGYLSVGASGLLKVGVIEIGTSALTLTERHIVSLRRLDPPRPFWRRKLGYARAWTVLSQDVIDAAAITDARADFMGSAQRFVISEDATITTALADSQDEEIATLLDVESDASDEADRQLALLGARRDLYELDVRDQAYQAEVGQTITVVHPSLRVPAGQDLIVRSVSERSGERTVIQALG